MYFVIYAKDRKDGLPIRKANRDAHLAFLRAPGHVKVIVAGPLLDDAGEVMIGSMLIVEAADLSAVKAWLTHDPYAKAGLSESVAVHPYIWAIGAPE